MSESRRSPLIRCPYFKYEDGRRHKIKCEGLGDARSMSWNYANEDEGQRIRQLEIFCQNDYQKCELYRMIQESKYD